MTEVISGPRSAELQGETASRRWSSGREVVKQPRRRFGLRGTSLRNHLHMAGHFGHNYVRKYYQDTFLGYLWLPLRPLADVFLASLLFGAFLQVPSGGKPYLLFLVCGSAGWFFFERMAYWGYRSLQYNQRYFRAIPVPWLPAITGTVVPALVQGFIYLLIAIGVAVYLLVADGKLHLEPGLNTLFVLPGLALLALYGWIVGLVFGPIVRVVRDVRLLLPFPIAFLYVLTPVVYPVEAIPEKYDTIALYNPLTAPIEMIRHGLLGLGLPSTASLTATLAVAAVALPIGLLLFARAERRSHEHL